MTTLTQKQKKQIREDIKKNVFSKIISNYGNVNYVKKGHWKINKSHTHRKENQETKLWNIIIPQQEWINEVNEIIKKLEKNLPKYLDNQILMSFYVPETSCKYPRIEVFLRCKKKKNKKNKLKKYYQKLPTDLQNIIKKDYLMDLLEIKYEKTMDDLEEYNYRYGCDDWGGDDIEAIIEEIQEEIKILGKILKKEDC